MLPIERLKRSNTIENLWVYILLLLKRDKIYGWEIPKKIEKKLDLDREKLLPIEFCIAWKKLVLSKVKLDKREGFIKSQRKEKKNWKKLKDFIKKF